MNDADFIAHYGVKGMKWGVRKKRDTPSWSTRREAAKDAKEFARAKMYYGEGAGVRRRLINNTVKAKAKKDPLYAKAYEEALAKQDYGKAAQEARRTRRATDTRTGIVKTAKGIYNAVSQNGYYVAPAAAAIVAGAGYAKSKGYDKKVAKYFNTALSAVKTEIRARHIQRNFNPDDWL